MRLRFWPLLFVALMWACGDDDSVAPETPNKPDPETPIVRKMSFQKYDVVAGEYDNWIILSDDNGTILDHKKLENNATYTFEAPAEFKEDVVNLTFIYNELVRIGTEDMKRTVISTYTDVPFGAYGNTPRKSSTQQQLGYVSVDGFLNNDQYGTYRVSTPQRGGVSYEFERYDKAQIYLRDTTDKSAIMIMSERPPFSYLYTEVNGMENYERSLEDFQPADMQLVYAPEGATTVSATLFGENIRGLFTYYASAPLEVESGMISVPYVQDVFKAYSGTYSTYLNGDRYSYYFAGLSILPTTLSILDAKIDYTVKDNVLSWQTQGTIDIARIRAAAVGDFPGGDAVYWDVYGGANKQVTPPVIPDDVTLLGATEGVYKTFQNLADGRTMQTEIVDGVDFNGYTAYVTGRYLKIGTRPNITGDKSRQGK